MTKISLTKVRISSEKISLTKVRISFEKVPLGLDVITKISVTKEVRIS